MKNTNTSSKFNQASKIFGTLLIIAFSIAASANTQVESSIKDSFEQYVPQAKYELLETSRNSVLIYEVVNINFNAKMFDKPKYLRGFRPILNNQPSYAKRSFSKEHANTVVKTNQNFADLMLTDVEIANIHRNVLKKNSLDDLSRFARTSNESTIEIQDDTVVTDQLLTRLSTTTVEDGLF